jgi:gas vesicle protein
MNNNHPLATGLLAGVAVGAGIGMLFAPRRGSETRTQLRGHVNRYADGISKGYRRASDQVGDLAHRGQGVYKSTREKVAQGAKETSRYMREVADAVTRKSRRLGEAQVRRPAMATSSGQSHDTRHKSF